MNCTTKLLSLKTPLGDDFLFWKFALEVGGLPQNDMGQIIKVITRFGRNRCLRGVFGD